MKDKHIWDLANKLTFDKHRERKTFAEGKSRMLDCARKEDELKLQRELYADYRDFKEVY